MIHACELCKYRDRCVDRPTSNVADCNVFVRQAPQTNADRIRAMSDEELAEFIKCPHDMHLGDCRAEESETIPCSECILQWLKSEVKE